MPTKGAMGPWLLPLSLFLRSGHEVDGFAPPSAPCHVVPTALPQAQKPQANWSQTEIS